jgi:hypothetical protein
MKRCCDTRLPFKRKKATKFRNIFFPGREGGARVVAQPVLFATFTQRSQSISGANEAWTKNLSLRRCNAASFTSQKQSMPPSR